MLIKVQLFSTFAFQVITSQPSVLVINMPWWSTPEIELLISKIEERQCLWNIFRPEYKDKAKKSDAWKEVSEILNRDQKEVSFFFAIYYLKSFNM